MKINWMFTERWGYSGIDEEGNIYNQGHLRETTSVILPDGREGGGWEPKDALDSAKRRTQPTTDYESEKKKLLPYL